MNKILLILKAIGEFIKKYGWLILVVVILGLCGIIGTQCSRNQKLKEQYEISMANEKSLWGRIEGNQKDIVAYQTTISSLRYINDSIVQHLLEVQEKLKIKDKEIQSMLSLSSHFHTTDTIILTDTIFKEPDFDFDTVIQDQWRKMEVRLKYPANVWVDATMRSQKEVFITSTRETIKPPKKCFFLRWFQKKHNVVRVKIEEDNPYLESEQNLYIQTFEK